MYLKLHLNFPGANELRSWYLPTVWKATIQETHPPGEIVICSNYF